MQFKVGDVVMLKSGGPVMTVTRVDSKDTYCTWFVEGEPKWKDFPPDALEHYQPVSAANTPRVRIPSVQTI